MNTANNRRRKESIKRIESVFVELIQTKEIEQITVSEICKKADINRSTFYSNYMDIFDLAEKIVKSLWEDFLSIYTYSDNKKERMNFTKLFVHIKDNQLLYKTYFKLGALDIGIVGFDKEVAEMFFDMKYLDYHIEFFKNGFNAVVKKWLFGGCKESPEEMNKILETEYKRDYSVLNE